MKINSGQKKPYTLGVMQGRLLPKYLGRYQAHPLGYWQDEFPIAAELGLDCVEFILDFNDYEKNPLLAAGGVAEIDKIASQTQVTVQTICADFFMQCPLHAQDRGKAELAQQVMKNLITNAATLGVSCIVIPCVDESSLQSEAEKSRFIEALGVLSKQAQKVKLELALETDLNAQAFKNLLAAIDCPNVKVNYDIGNSAALGFDFLEEFAAYGDVICDVHIKDRVLGGSSVLLGTGNAKIESVLKKLRAMRFKGPYVMQAYRDDEGLSIFRKQLQMTRSWLDAIYGG